MVSGGSNHPRHTVDKTTGIVHAWNYDLDSTMFTPCGVWFEDQWEEGQWKPSNEQVTCLGCLAQLR